ncbi:hypothetical protein HYALB_00013983 [Hymenoscyphus albidus]|uniref:histone acetyltransferase n=1 Tax=Hymenoscyphus albidus TaxID=595503 RepID=A0A9N9LY62_9HELO|nr:hypothetical protein HYALB_00013983 [Hymenoscyphus albidus]
MSSSSNNERAQPKGIQKSRAPAQLPSSFSSTAPTTSNNESEQRLGVRVVAGLLGHNVEQVFDKATSRTLSSRPLKTPLPQKAIDDHEAWKKKALAQQKQEQAKASSAPRKTLTGKASAPAKPTVAPKQKASTQATEQRQHSAKEPAPRKPLVGHKNGPPAKPTVTPKQKAPSQAPKKLQPPAKAANAPRKPVKNVNTKRAAPTKPAKPTEPINAQKAAPPPPQRRRKLVSGAEVARARAEKAEASASVPAATTANPGEKRKLAESAPDARVFGSSGDVNQPPKRQKVDAVEEKIVKSPRPSQDTPAKPVSKASSQKKTSKTNKTPPPPPQSFGGKQPLEDTPPAQSFGGKQPLEDTPPPESVGGMSLLEDTPPPQSFGGKQPLEDTPPPQSFGGKQPLEDTPPPESVGGKSAKKRKLSESSQEDGESHASEEKSSKSTKRRMTDSKRRNVDQESKPEFEAWWPAKRLPEQAEFSMTAKIFQGQMKASRKTPKTGKKNKEPEELGYVLEDYVVEEGILKPDDWLPREAIDLWFASWYHQVSQISEDLYERNQKNLPKKKVRVRTKAEKAYLDKQEKDFVKGEKKGHTDHHKMTRHKRKLDMEAWELAYGDEAKRRKLLPAPNRDPSPFQWSSASASSPRSASSGASDRTSQTSMNSEKDPASPPSSVLGPDLGPNFDFQATFGLAFTSMATPRSTTLTTNSFGDELLDTNDMVREKIEKRMVDVDENFKKCEQDLLEQQRLKRESPRQCIDKAERKQLVLQLAQGEKDLKKEVKKAKITRERAHRNIDHVVFGSLCFPTWYSSDYPKSTLHNNIDKELPKEPVLDRMYVCEKCFAYTSTVEDHVKHHRLCSDEIRGQKIYDHAGAGVWSIHEVDGGSDILFCQNLSLFAKLFLGDKSVSYYTSLFYYYCLVHKDPTTGHQQVVGFFSKEKNSYDKNNLACILVFPPWQNMSLGKMLIGVSYEISRMEQSIGGPERPFSSLGEKSYRRYWQAELARWILEHPTTDKKKGCHLVDIQRISRETCIMEKDCIDTINSMNLDLLIPYGGPDAGQPVILDQEKVREWVKENRVNLDRVVDKGGFLVDKDVFVQLKRKNAKAGSNNGD